ncbi:hypothetical protein AG1IA_08763 [Rhizoctonia solani AG-1 IA]|uniref:Uncharacterized protein n=1 Tax=Thanatephorus cucumeris (strain AG1-IA) TaxID=983506 RepID=L8WH06_THACA|nr:hypothetical protein AG1IA_08763 [Rhizoctonia solani AG-1 IA]
MKIKRGGGGGTFTETSVSSQPRRIFLFFATTPPASTQHHGHKIPEIAGSSGGMSQFAFRIGRNLRLFNFAGFLGLVIGLGVLIIACCAGVYILMKRRKDRGDPLWRSRKSVGNSMSQGILGGSRSKRGWVRTGDDDHHMGDRSQGIGLSAPRSRSRSPNPEMYSNRDQGASASSVKLSAPGPYPDAFVARDSIDSLVEGPHQSRGNYQGVSEHDHEDTKYSPTSSRFRERI